jgi:hypothetical protein
MTHAQAFELFGLPAVIVVLVGVIILANKFVARY